MDALRYRPTTLEPYLGFLNSLRFMMYFPQVILLKKIQTKLNFTIQGLKHFKTYLGRRWLSKLHNYNGVCRADPGFEQFCKILKYSLSPIKKTFLIILFSGLSIKKWESKTNGKQKANFSVGHKNKINKC